MSLHVSSCSDDWVSEGAEEAAESALPPADLQAAGGGDERPWARLPADESLQADDQGDAFLFQKLRRIKSPESDF